MSRGPGEPPGSRRVADRPGRHSGGPAPDVPDRLCALLPPDASGAEERNWAVARRAFAERRPAPRRRARRAGAAAITAVVAVLGALSPAGAALGDWVHDAVRGQRPPPRPALTGLPAAGSLLALAGNDLWLVHADGARRRLGTADDATFSAHARFVATARGSRLTAIDRRGRVRWSLDRPGGVADPRWAPSGLRIAYHAGRDLRVVFGDGLRDRHVAARVAAVPAAWRPGSGHVLAWADRRGRVVVGDTDRRRRLWRSAPGRIPTGLHWDSGGRRLLVLRPGSATTHTARGRRLAAAQLTGTRPAAAWLPRGGFVTVTARGTRSEVVRHGSGGRVVLFEGPGRIDGLVPSPDGRWLLLGWSAADQWLFVRADGSGRPRAAAGMARDFAPEHAPAPPFPRPLAWR